MKVGKLVEEENAIIVDKKDIFRENAHNLGKREREGEMKAGKTVIRENAITVEKRDMCPGIAAKPK